MAFVEKIREDMTQALRDKSELRLSVLRMLSSALHNRALAKRARTGKEEALDEAEAFAVLKQEMKKRKEAILEFERGGRRDLSKKENQELKILAAYAPAEIDDAVIEQTVRDVVKSFGGASEKDFGRLMGEVMKRLKGQASGERVSEAVKKALK